MHRRLPATVILAVLCVVPLPGAAQGFMERAAAVRTIPERPVQGTLFVVEVRDAESPRGGRFAGEPLHFEPRGDGTFRALAAMPVDAEGARPLSIVGWVGTETDSLRIDVPVAAGEYRMERLTVAPRYGTRPDAATAARITAEAERARDVSRRSHRGGRLWDGEVILPRDSRITSGFGNGRMFNGEVQSRHMGTDFAGAVGAPIRAPARGTVALVDAFHLGGNVLYIDHGGGLVTGYLHLSRVDVESGAVVERGQTIGAVGATGRVTGPHLHWIVRYGTVTVDPMSWFAAAEVYEATRP